MLFRLLMLLAILPLLEIAVLVWLASKTGLLFTVALLLGMGVLGAALARYEGWRVWQKVQDQLRRGEVPTDSLLDGFLIFVAGLLLVLPGVLSDVLALLLLIPPTRHFVRSVIRERLRARFRVVSLPGDRIVDVRVVEDRPERLKDRRQEGTGEPPAPR